MRRNLHYFVYPIRGSIWGWNVDQIRPFLPLFNGRKFVTVAEDDGTEPFETVAAKFEDPSISFRRVRNVAPLGQVVGFLEVMEQLRSDDPGEITLYAHARGVSHWMPTVACVMAHTEAMYLLCLGRIDLVDRIMARRPLAGPFRQTNTECTSWLFAGCFYWFRHSDVFSRNWRDIAQNRWGVEDYPGRHFAMDEAFSLSGDKYYGDLYRQVLLKEDLHWMIRELPSAVDHACGAARGPDIPIEG